MADYNKVLLMGRLTRDPELRFTPQQVPVTELGLAVNRDFGGGEGTERRKEVAFIDVTFWRRRAEVICQYLHKGDPIFIEGYLRMDTWETQEGEKRSKLRVTGDNFQFINSRSSREGGGGGAGGGGGGGGEGFTDYQYPGESSGGWSGGGEGGGEGGGGGGGRLSESSTGGPPGGGWKEGSGKGAEGIEDGDIPF